MSLSCYSSSTLVSYLQQRKLMSKKEYKGRHHNWGGLIMGLGTATAVAGPVNTYLRSGSSGTKYTCI